MQKVNGSCQNKLASLLSSLAEREGQTETGIPGVSLYRKSAPEESQPVVYDPCIVIIGQGQKRGYLGDRQFTYDANQYLVISVPMPFMCEVKQASVDQPFLALALSVDVSLIGELLMTMSQDQVPVVLDSMPDAVGAEPLSDAILTPAVQLLKSLESPLDASVLGPQYVREITYRILLGPLGPALKATVLQNSRFHHIAKVMKYLHGHYGENCSIENLARMANMSQSSLHHHFKAVTTASPVQYLKSIRLHKARALLLQGEHNASSAADHVGYSSNSQFSREYKRFFGVAPSADIERIR